MPIQNPPSLVATVPVTLGISNGPALNSGQQTYYLAFNGANVDATENQTQTRMNAGTFSRLRIYVVTNTSNVSVQVALRVNGATSALSITVPNGQTGFFTDDAHTVTINQNDLCNIIETGVIGSGSFDIDFGSIDFAATPTSTLNVVYQPNAGANVSFGTMVMGSALETNTFVVSGATSLNGVTANNLSAITGIFGSAQIGYLTNLSGITTNNNFSANTETIGSSQINTLTVASRLLLGSTTYTQLSAGTLSANYVNIGVAGGLQGLGVYTQVSRVIVTSPVQVINFTGLNILNDGAYQFFVNYFTVGGPSYSVCVNGLSALTDYGGVQIAFTGSTATATPGLLAGPILGGSVSGTPGTVMGTITLDAAGYFRATTQAQHGTAGPPTSAAMVYADARLWKYSSLTNITGINFISTVASGWGTSSQITLYKLTAG